MIKRLVLIGAALVLAGCASDGSLAGKGKPIDKEQTRLALCEGAQKIDIAWAAIVKANPGLIPGDATSAEAAFIDTVGFVPGSPEAARAGSICAKQYAGDLDVAINTAIVAISNISGLIKAWSN